MQINSEISFKMQTSLSFRIERKRAGEQIPGIDVKSLVNADIQERYIHSDFVQETAERAKLASKCKISRLGQTSECTGISSNSTCAVRHEILSMGTSLLARATFPEKVSGGQPVLLCWPCSLVNNLVGDFLHRKFTAA